MSHVKSCEAGGISSHPQKLLGSPFLIHQPGGMVRRECGWRKKSMAKGSVLPRAHAGGGQPALPAVASERPSGEPGSPFPIALRGSGLGLGEVAGPAPY